MHCNFQKDTFHANVNNFFLSDIMCSRWSPVFWSFSVVCGHLTGVLQRGIGQSPRFLQHVTTQTQNVHKQIRYASAQAAENTSSA